jgi:formylglycine-generating enzyme required for sulfatase activity
MIRRNLLSIGFVAALVGGCSVRGANAGDLTGSVNVDKAADAGAAPGSDGTVRLAGYKCVKPPPPATPSKLLPVPAGPFLMGCNPQYDTECKKDELPTHSPSLGAYSIEMTEVSQLQYYECVQSGACLAPTCDWDPCGARSEHPVVCVDREDAETYCLWKHERLPSEAEWEKAARGAEGLKFPWGNDSVDCNHTNMSGCKLGANGKDDTAPVGSFPAGASPYGALDMAGNVVEWTADFYDPNYYAMSPAAEPTGPAKAQMYVGRGGGFRSLPYWHRASTRDDYEPSYFKNSTGFRCAR